MARFRAEWVSWKTSRGSAKLEKAVPRVEMVWPVQNFQKSPGEACTPIRYRCLMNVVVLPGDGIGPEVSAGAVAVLERMAQRHGLPLTLTEDLVGGASIEAHGSSLRPETIQRCKRADAILFGAVAVPAGTTPTPIPGCGPGPR